MQSGPVWPHWAKDSPNGKKNLGGKCLIKDKDGREVPTLLLAGFWVGSANSVEMRWSNDLAENRTWKLQPILLSSCLPRWLTRVQLCWKSTVRYSNAQVHLTKCIFEASSLMRSKKLFASPASSEMSILSSHSVNAAPALFTNPRQLLNR